MLQTYEQFEYTQPSCQVSRVSQAVVPGTDDDRIVALHDNISRAAL